MAINLGSFVTVNGRTVSTGSQSGLDTDQLIKDLVGVREAQIKTITDKQTKVKSQVTEFGTYRNLLNKFKSSLNLLRNPPGFGQESNNVFKYRTTQLSTSNGSLASNFLNVTATPGAKLAKYEMTIDNIAQSRQLRGNTAYSSTTADLTTGGGITPGTFTIRSSLYGVHDETFSASEYSISGAGAGIVAAAGINNFQVTGDGDSGLQGTIGGFTATVDGTNVDLSVTINGRVYTANDVPANTGAGTDSIASGSITFTNAATGTSFDVVLGSDYVIAGNQTNANNFASALTTGLSGVSVYQSRELGNFSKAATTGTVISGLESQYIRFVSDGFDNASLRQGSISKFTVTAVSTAGANDGSIEVVINGETFRATGLGDDGSDVENDNILLESLTTDKRLEINLADAGISVSLSSPTNATKLQNALNSTLGTFSEDVTIAAGASLASVVSAINAKSSTTGVSASTIQVGANDFRLSITADSTGFEGGFDLVNATAVFGASPFTVVKAEEDAEITLDGVTIRRGTNNINDAVTGVTFGLLQETTGGVTLSSEIKEDSTAVQNAILDFAAAYNEIKIFLSKQSQRDADGKFLDDAVLGSNTLVRTTSQSFDTELNRLVSGLGSGALTRLSEIGASFADLEADEATETPFTRNLLQFDQTKLASAVQSDFDAVRALFEFTLTSSASDKLGISKRTNALNVSAFEIDIDTSRADGDKVRVTYNDGTNDVQINATLTGTAGNYKIVGQSGTVLEGLEFVYVGDGTDVIDVTTTQGIGDRLYNVTDGLVADNGLLDTEVANLGDSVDDLQQNIDRENTRLEDYRARLLAQFSAFESQLSKINSTLSFLEAQVAVQNRDN